jgi:hypothetical protein
LGERSVDYFHEMYDARVARVAALYKAGTATDYQPREQENTPAKQALVASLWQAELAKSMAALERKRRK